LFYIDDYVIISRGLIASGEGGRMCATACASTTRARRTRQLLINYAAISNACKSHKNNALAFSSRLKCACSGAVSSPYQPLAADRTSLPRPFLFSTNERTRKKANLFTTNKKQFLFDTFGRFSGVLFNTLERPSIYPFLPATPQGKIAAL
jgi:hypothetical protein